MAGYKGQRRYIVFVGLAVWGFVSLAKESYDNDDRSTAELRKESLNEVLEVGGVIFLVSFFCSFNIYIFFPVPLKQ